MGGQTPRVGLALGGGAARGLAHLGVLEVLEENGLRPSFVAGTSAGAIVGAAYAAGVSPSRMRERASRITWADLTEPVIPRRSLLGTKRLQAWLEDTLGGRAFADLVLPFVCTAADILTGEEVWLSDPGLRVSQAVRASCAIPGVFPPVRVAGRLLVDGGVFGAVPVRAAKALGGGPVVAVHVAGAPFTGREPQTVVATVVAALAIMQRTRDYQEMSLADAVIAPPTEAFSLMDLGAAERLAELGRTAALAALPDLLRLWAGENPGGQASRPAR
ncbi:MAG: patatin-like phospholipase family protein [bacterium]|nr:patatin-like phospholipase family protein [bacterium]